MLLESLKQEVAWADTHLWIISIRLCNTLWRGMAGNWKIIHGTIVNKSHGDQGEDFEVSLTKMSHSFGDS